jgi:hypothetical protein
MEFETPILEQRITIEGKRYTYDLVVSGWGDYEDDNNYTSFSNITTSIFNICKYGKEIESTEIMQEIEYRINNDLEDILHENGEII